jgi:hypothetical protein
LPSGNIVSNNKLYIKDQTPNFKIGDGTGEYMLNFGNINTITNNKYVQLHQSMPIFRVELENPYRAIRYPFDQWKENINADISSQIISTNIPSYKINFLT